MDVSLWNGRLLLLSLLGLLGLLSLSGCGNRFDLSTERGIRARIDEANFHLSQGECALGLEAINHVYYSSYVTEEVRLVKASAHACVATFNLFNMVSNLSSASDYFVGMAKSMTNSAGDGASSSMYTAVDVLTQNGSLTNASARSQTVNNYMVFLQMGVVGSILRNYGSPATDGKQTVDLVYSAVANPAGEMSNLDACALAASIAIFYDSVSYSSITDSSVLSFKTSINNICVAAGLASCNSINKDRTACDGTNADSVVAAAVVTQVNSAWGN